MKTGMMIVLMTVIASGLTLAQVTVNSTPTYLHGVEVMEDQRISATIDSSLDKGLWIGILGGAQANGGDIGDRWTLGGICEWKYSNTFSLPLEYQLYRDRAYVHNEVGQYGKFLETRPFISCGIKARTKMSSLSPFLQVGYEHTSGSGFSLGAPYCAVGMEVFISEDLVFCTKVRKNAMPDFYHFVTVGFTVNLVRH